MPSSSSATTTTHTAPEQSRPALAGWNFSARNDGSELLAQAREVLALNHALLRREGALMKACRAAGISITDLYQHACR